jgi:hypothetical protein
LCPSESAAADWKTAGAKVATRANIESVVSDLRARRTTFAVLAQRYDGVDLPDDACRVLVLDGMPFGQGLIDTYDASRARHVAGPRNKLVYRIEQGMGRAVRSPADYALVVLAGPELAAYVSNADVRPHFGRDLQLQLEVAQELASYTRTEEGSPSEVFNDIAERLLRRDANWRAYYDDRVRRQLAGGTAAVNESAVHAARLEREASLSAEAGDITTACSKMSDAVALAKTEQGRATLLEEKARYLFTVDPGEAMKIQAVAYAASRAVLRPPIGASAKPPRHEDAATRVLALAKRYSSRNGLIAAFAALRAELSINLPPSRFEPLFQQLAEFLGTDSSRPEKETGHGPDNLVLWADLSLVVEAKNGAKYAAIPKRDAEQLLHSMEWFRTEYPHAVRPTPIFIGPAIESETGVHPPPGTRVITPELLEKLLGAAAAFIAAIGSKAIDQWSVTEINVLLTSHGLGSGQFLQTFTKSI